ncbi:FUSC family protein [Micromonospora yasonensis]|uniref:FUSC family protein n=1 Tax=Micromonospora yasonensis TaxID=1128667 RepID=UPI00222E36C9|nr:FUSC family protein [Micromonospora yasonensis]MCW3839899.1 FUSC family protein [Micromonospora yasonensis]
MVSLLGDPQRSAPRDAVRAALVLPGLFAFGRYVVGNQSFATFTVFGGFALLIMSDFGGTRRERARSYLLATTAGAVLVAVGTVVARSAVAVPLVMFAVALVTTFLAAVVGGHVGTARLGLLLSFVLTVTLPPAAGQIPVRVAGWVFAGVVATVAGLLLLPRAGPVALTRAAAEACRAVADLVAVVARDPGDPELSRFRDVAATAVGTARERYADTASRAVGSRRRLHAYAELLGDLHLLVSVVRHPLYRPYHLARRSTGTEGEMVEAVSGALRAGAATLEGAAGEPDVAGLDRRRRAHQRALERWVRKLLDRSAPAEQVLAALAVDHTLRVLAYLSTSVAVNASAATGRRAGIGSGRSPTALDDQPARHRRLRWLASSAAPNSTALRDSLRAAVGLALSVWLAARLGLPHAFWVVLGTLQVLRTNALGTARSVARAIAGNVVGVLGGSALVIAAGGRPGPLWAVLPVAVFLSAYTANSQRFLLSQAAFTLDLMIIFNLLAPVGWRLGLIRLADVGVGVAVSVVLSLVLWPYGARRQFVRSVAAYHRAAVDQLRRAFDQVLAVDAGGRPSAPPAGPRIRAELALADYLSERPTGPLDVTSAVALLTGANYLVMAASLMRDAVRLSGYRADACRDLVEPVRSAQQALLGGLARSADRLTDGRTPSFRPTVPDLGAPVWTCLRRWRGDEAVAGSAMALAVAAEWLRGIDQVGDDLAGPVDRAVVAAGRPWWR